MAVFSLFFPALFGFSFKFLQIAVRKNMSKRHCSVAISPPGSILTIPIFFVILAGWWLCFSLFLALLPLILLTSFGQQANLSIGCYFTLCVLLRVSGSHLALSSFPLFYAFFSKFFTQQSFVPR
jgi:hypothetical protein